jgi:hypothetical protein
VKPAKIDRLHKVCGMCASRTAQGLSAYGTAEQKPLRALISLNAQYRHRFAAKSPFSDQIGPF